MGTLEGISIEIMILEAVFFIKDLLTQESHNLSVVKLRNSCDYSEVSDQKYVFHWRPAGKSQGSCSPVWKDWSGLWAPAPNCLASVWAA